MLIHDAAVPRYLAGSNSRDEAIALEYNSGGYGLKEIGEHFGLHYSRVSRIIIRFGAGRRKTRQDTVMIFTTNQLKLLKAWINQGTVNNLCPIV